MLCLWWDGALCSKVPEKQEWGWANGQVEQVMSILKNLLSVVESSQRSWQDVLGEVQLALNSTISRATEASPLEMLIGKQARPLGLVPPCEPECEIDLAILSAHARRAQTVERQCKRPMLVSKLLHGTQAPLLALSFSPLALLSSRKVFTTPRSRGTSNVSFKWVLIYKCDNKVQKLKSIPGV